MPENLTEQEILTRYFAEVDAFPPIAIGNEDETTRPRAPSIRQASIRNQSLRQSSLRKESSGTLEVKGGDHVANQPEKPKDPEWIKRREKFIARERLLIPVYKFKEAILIIAIILVLGAVRGGKAKQSIAGIVYCSSMDFGMMGIIMGAFLLCLLRNIWLIKGWQNEKFELEIPFTPEDPEIMNRDFRNLAIRGVIGGFLGALAAISGSLIMTPAIFDLGVPPAIAACTAGMFMIFTMFNSMTQTYLAGGVTFAQIGWFAGIACVFSFCSSRLVNYFVRKTGRQAFIPGMVMFLSSTGFIVILALLITYSVENWANEVHFKPKC